MTAETGSPGNTAGSDRIEVGADLFTVLDLEQIEHNIFRGMSSRSRWQRAFGGAVAAQALVAAGRTVPTDRHVHSLHSYFLRPGDSAAPIVYMVERVRDGGSFTTRRVTAVQHGETIFTLSASFQLTQDGVEHQAPMPDVPAPEDLPTAADFYREAGIPAQSGHDLHPLDLRYIDKAPTVLPDGKPYDGPIRLWMRAARPLPDDPLIHLCALTYASDVTLLSSVAMRHALPMSRIKNMASLDHAMWFMRPVKADEWFLYEFSSPVAAGSRGLATGRFFSQQGEHLASVVQEGLVRLNR